GRINGGNGGIFAVKIMDADVAPRFSSANYLSSSRAFHADLPFGTEYHQRLLDIICCHLVIGGFLDQAVCLSGKQVATNALHHTDSRRRFFAGERLSAV